MLACSWRKRCARQNSVFLPGMISSLGTYSGKLQITRLDTKWVRRRGYHGRSGFHVQYLQRAIVFHHVWRCISRTGPSIQRNTSDFIDHAIISLKHVPIQPFRARLGSCGLHPLVGLLDWSSHTFIQDLCMEWYKHRRFLLQLGTWNRHVDIPGWAFSSSPGLSRVGHAKWAKWIAATNSKAVDDCVVKDHQPPSAIPGLPDESPSPHEDVKMWTLLVVDKFTPARSRDFWWKKGSCQSFFLGCHSYHSKRHIGPSKTGIIFTGGTIHDARPWEGHENLSKVLSVHDQQPSTVEQHRTWRLR